MSGLGLEGKRILVTGLSNRRSVAWYVGQALEENGVEVIYTLRTAERRAENARLLGERPALLCDVLVDGQVDDLASALADRYDSLDGFVHSIARADYADINRENPTLPAFEDTGREEFLRAVDVSCYSLIAFARALAPMLAPGSSAVALSISDTQMAAENYGFMSPAKAALESAVGFLARSFGREREVRFNAVKAGILKTRSSAGIPGFLESYLYGEEATLRGRALTTREVADPVLFLLSPLSSGINGQGIIVDAGMGLGYFHRDLVHRAVSRDGGDS
jgi:enoyl-[acyl-carrier protein] reductase I